MYNEIRFKQKSKYLIEGIQQAHWFSMYMDDLSGKNLYKQKADLFYNWMGPVVELFFFVQTGTVEKNNSKFSV